MPAIAPEDNWEQIDAAAFENAERDLYSNTYFSWSSFISFYLV